MQQLQYQMAGSTGTIHTVRLTEDNGKISFKCSCRGSVNRQILCKHRLALLTGDLTDLVDINSWDSKKFIDVISLLNINHQLDEFLKLSGYRRAYYELRDLSRKVDSTSEPKDITLLDISSYEKLLNNNHFAIDSQTKGVAENIYDWQGEYIGSIKTRHGKSKLKSLMTVSFQSEKYLRGRNEYYDGISEDESDPYILSFHYINVTVNNQSPAYLGQTILNKFRDEAKKIAKFFDAI